MEGDRQEEEEEERAAQLDNDDSALNDTIRFYRQQQRLEFDTDSEDDVSCTQADIDRVLGVPPDWHDEEPSIFIYIDDANGVEKVRVPGSIVNITQDKQKTKVHAQKSEELLKTVSIRSSAIGMKVNHAKTQLLCVSASNTQDITSYLRGATGKICSSDELKNLGFIFGNKPSVQPHVNYMLQKARKKLWVLRNLKRMGMGEADLLNIFNVIVQPVLEYAAPTYHPMLTGEMTAAIETIQRRASKIILGWNCDYNELLNSEKLQSLNSRRDTLTKNFAQKVLASNKGPEWFPLKPESAYQIRKEKSTWKRLQELKDCRRAPYTI